MLSGLTPRDILLSSRTHFEDKEGRYCDTTLEAGATGVQLQLCRRNTRPEIMSIHRRTVVCLPLKSECLKSALSFQQNGILPIQPKQSLLVAKQNPPDTCRFV